MTAKIGYVNGKCSRCGRIYHAKRPAFPVYCDCYLTCPECGATMEPCAPDLTSLAFYSEGIKIFYKCPACGYLSSLLPVEVVLK